MYASSQLSVRRTVRQELVIPARLRIDADHASAVPLRGGGDANGRASWIDCETIDVSEMGAGVVSPVFLPRMTRVVIDLLNPGGIDLDPVVAGLPARVLRVVMTDRRPAYLLGLSIEPGRLPASAREGFATVLRSVDLRLAGSLGGSEPANVHNQASARDGGPTDA